MTSTNLTLQGVYNNLQLTKALPTNDSEKENFLSSHILYAHLDNEHNSVEEQGLFIRSATAHNPYNHSRELNVDFFKNKGSEELTMVIPGPGADERNFICPNTRYK
jgi:hypothetical protein